MISGMKKVTVLMSTYNGEKYLRTQIDSILNQKGVDINLLVRDDGSKDNTLEILKEYALNDKLKWYNGKNLKSAKSFMDLLKNSDNSEYYAFSDQDDYWLPEKLYRAVSILEKQPSNIPALYYSETTIVDENLNKLSQRKETRIAKKFNNAVISSNATGCTFCFNKKLRDLINEYEPSYQIMHDGWVHKVCLALDGYVYFDQNSYIKYRQHGNNVVGGTTTPIKRWKRRINTIKTNPCPRSRGIRELLNGYYKYMSKDNINICKEISNYKKTLKNRMILIFDKNIYSSNKRIDIIFRLTVLLGIF